MKCLKTVRVLIDIHYLLTESSVHLVLSTTCFYHLFFQLKFTGENSSGFDNNLLVITVTVILCVYTLRAN